jgi:hypothetical protein
MRSITVITFLVIFLTLMSGSFCIATGEVPAPKQEIKYDYSGPCKELIGMWTGTLGASQDTRRYDFQHRNVANWDFNLYVISVNDRVATGIYCWSAVGKAVPDCIDLKGTLEPDEDKLVFQWGEKRVLTIYRTPKVADYRLVIFQRGEARFEGLAKKMEK